MSDRPRCPAGTGELAGFGTDHPGEGLCKWHSGSTTQRKREHMNEQSKRTLELARHLSKSYGRNDGHASAMAEKSAFTILADPQAHIDALVAAGVLERSSPVDFTPVSYRVVAPKSPVGKVFDQETVTDIWQSGYAVGYRHGAS